MDYLSAAATFMPLLILFFRFRWIKKMFPELIVMVCVANLADLYNGVNFSFGFNNYFIFHIYTVLEFFIWSYFYFKIFRRFVHPIVFYLVLVGFLIVAYMEARIKGWDSMDSFSISTESIILIICSGSLYYYVLKNLIYENLLKTPIFWINTAVLCYFSGNLFLFAFSNYIMSQDPLVHNFLWATIHTFFNVTYNILLSIGFWKIKNT